MSGAEDFDRVGELLGDACEAAATTDPPIKGDRTATNSTEADPRWPQTSPRDLARAISEAWTEVVGSEVAENATPVRLNRGSLVVSTSSSVWADALHYMSAELVAKLNNRIGCAAVSGMVFRQAGWQERPKPPAARAYARSERRRLTSEEEQAVAQVGEYDLPPALKERAVRAMRRSLERSKRDPVR